MQVQPKRKLVNQTWISSLCCRWETSRYPRIPLPERKPSVEGNTSKGKNIYTQKIFNVTEGIDCRRNDWQWMRFRLCACCCTTLFARNLSWRCTDSSRKPARLNRHWQLCPWEPVSAYSRTSDGFMLRLDFNKWLCFPERTTQICRESPMAML